MKLELKKMKQPTVLVVVLGNIGQSPRMKNHIEQLSIHGYNVIILAYQGTFIEFTFISIVW